MESNINHCLNWRIILLKSLKLYSSLITKGYHNKKHTNFLLGWGNQPTQNHWANSCRSCHTREGQSCSEDCFTNQTQRQVIVFLSQVVKWVFTTVIPLHFLSLNPNLEKGIGILKVSIPVSKKGLWFWKSRSCLDCQNPISLITVADWSSAS